MEKTLYTSNQIIRRITCTVFAGLLLSLLMNCSSSKKAAGKKADDNIVVTFLQVNDVYEISPLDEGRSGGLARVASLRKKLATENSNTYTMLAGDFLSPSAMGTIRMADGKRIDGLQMIEALNATGVDLVTFGNHEFDLSESQLQDRINQSTFDWVSSNVKHRESYFAKTVNGESKQIPSTIVRSFKDADGTTVNIGIFSVTINSTIKDYVKYTDYVQAAGDALKELEGKCDFVVALTHLQYRDDSILAVRYPSIKMIIGGHEHVNSYDKVGNTIIAKADANARTAYKHSVMYNTQSKEVKISSDLVRIDQTLEDDQQTGDVVKKWNDLGYSLLQKKFDPCEVIATLPEPFDGTEHNIRSKPTNLTQLIGEAVFFGPAVKPDCAIFNSGGVRIDDYLKGNVTNYDIFRVLPFGGKIFVAKMKGSLLKTIFAISDTSEGNGCFLQSVGITKNESFLLINDKPVMDDEMYRVAINDFLISGFQERMTFLKDAVNGNVDSLATLPGVGLNDKNDWPQAVANYMKRKYPADPSKAGRKATSLPCN